MRQTQIYDITINGFPFCQVEASNKYEARMAAMLDNQINKQSAPFEAIWAEINLDAVLYSR